MTMRLQAATVRFGAVTALEDASVDIQPGVVTAVIGPNAAGKSTLLRVLAGLQRLQAGAVSIDGLAVEQFLDTVGGLSRFMAIGEAFSGGKLCEG